MTEPSRQGPLGFRIIGAFKLATTVLLVAAGLGVFRLLDKDMGEVVERFITRMHLDPDNRLIQGLIAQASGLDRKRLEVIGVGTFVYALLHLIEGTGLILERTWAGFLTVVITGSLLPLELYEVARKPGAMRIAVLVVNLGIVVYLIVKLIQERRSGAKNKRTGTE